MPTEILMPALSPTMEKARLAKWVKKEGDKVKPGDVIAEIETDKATMEVEAVDEGALAKSWFPKAREGVQGQYPIAVLLETARTSIPLQLPPGRQPRVPLAAPRCAGACRTLSAASP